MSTIKQAVSCFEQGFSCSQAVLSAFGPQLGLDRETALRVAGAFGGGMARMGETCRAVTGAFMVIGLQYGMTEPEDERAKSKTYAVVSEFVDLFRSQNGFIVCKQLLNCDISIPEQRQLALEKGLFATLCPRFVQSAVTILDEILDVQGSA